MLNNLPNVGVPGRAKPQFISAEPFRHAILRYRDKTGSVVTRLIGKVDGGKWKILPTPETAGGDFLNDKFNKMVDEAIVNGSSEE